MDTMETSHATQSVTLTHKDVEFDAYPTATTVVIDGWNYSQCTSSADTLLKVSCFRVLDNDPDGRWCERHPVLDGQVHDLGDADYDTKRAMARELKRDAFEAGVLGFWFYKGEGV